MTGETGSGKSIIVDSLGLILGKRSSQEMIRSNCDTAQLEGLFSLGSNANTAKLLANQELNAVTIRS